MKGLGDRVKSLLSTILILAILLGVGFGAGYYYRNSQITPEAEVVEDETDDLDVKLPTEEEKRVVTKDEVEAKLVEIGELSTYMGEYHVEKAADFSRYLIDKVAIPGSTNMINLSCDGIVKISYQISDVEIAVKEDTIFIGLPEGYVSDNYLMLDSLECDEQNSILNPIDFSEYQGLFDEMEEEGLAEAEEQGIYEAADKNAENIIVNFLGAFDGYTVQFM